MTTIDDRFKEIEKVNDLKELTYLSRMTIYDTEESKTFSELFKSKRKEYVEKYSTT